jgi:16S rRNA (guanine1207-N2)-methyltransferase
MKALARAAAEVDLGAGDVAVVYGAADRGELAALLTERFPDAAVVVAAQDARQAAAARERAGGARVVVAERLAEAVDAPAQLVAMVPGGYEGKARLRAMIADAAAVLAPGGALVIVSHARRGAGSLLRMADDSFGGADVVARGWGGMRVLRAVRSGGGPPAAGAAPDSQPLVEADLLGRRLSFETAPGVFSRERLDPGTRLLIESVDLGERRAAVLDLGCGYGPIGIAVAAAAPEAKVTMIDVDAAAVALAAGNATRNGVTVEAIVSDGPAGLGGRRFDLILSHFPLHAPRGDRDRLVQEAHDALTPGGRLCVVLLKEYDLSDPLERVFGEVTRVAESDRYVVLGARRDG